MKVVLVQEIRLHAKKKSRTCIRSVASVGYRGKIKPGQQENWTNVSLVVPPVCSSSNEICKIIQVSYAIRLSFEAGFFSFGNELIIPLVIGTVPLMNTGMSVPSDLPFIYQESIFDPIINQTIPIEYDINGSIVETNIKTFRPCYPYYNKFSVI